MGLILLFVSSTVFAQNWQTNFIQSKELAATENKTIVLVFAGSDWCAPCMRLENEIWESDEFRAYAKNNYVLHKADFPRKKTNKLNAEQVKINKELAAKYNTKGYFPFVVLIDKDGNILGETGYKKMAPKEYIKHLESLIKK